MGQEAKQQRLGKLKPRDTRIAREHSAHYSRTVDMLRWALPLAALAGLGILFSWPLWQSNKLSAVMVDNIPNLMIEKLNLNGLDEKGQPYALTADRALQAADTRNLVDLEQPKGEITLTDGAWVAVHAQKGRLDQTGKTLWLGGDVEIFHDQGYRFSSQEMNVDIPHSVAWGMQPVQIQGNFGEINGTAFRVLDGGAVLVVVGPARATLDLQTRQTPVKQNINTSPAR